MSANKTIVQADETNTQVEKATYGVVIVVAGVKDLNNNQVYNATIAHGIIVGNDNLNFL
jgi:DNA gyrase inhibitor GyrI